MSWGGADGLEGAFCHADAAAMAAMDVDEGRFVTVDAHDGTGLAAFLRQTFAAVLATAVIDK
ncbi:MAG: hypothetical protein R3E31_08250 [Chloroflexota bacterium]